MLLRTALPPANLCVLLLRPGSSPMASLRPQDAAMGSPSQVHAVLGLDRPEDVGRRMEKRKTPSIC